MSIIRKSTARTILVGPVLDSTGAAKTDEVVASIKVTKNGTVGAINGSATLTHDHAGKYRLAYTATDSDTVGLLEFSLNSGTNDMPIVRLNVVEEAVFDALFAASAAGYQVPIWATAGSTVNLSATTIKTLTDAVALPATATIAITGNITGNLSGSVGSVTGAVGSVTGNVGGSVASVVGLTASNLDATISSRMATYTQPTGFLAATFPTTVASTTNITAATGVTLAAVTHTGAVIPTVSAVTGLTASNLDATISSRMATYTQPTGFLAATFPTTLASQTSVDDLPTNAELVAALAAADDATLTAIAALNNISAAEVVAAMGTGTFLTAIPWNAAWDAEVQSEAADALAAYGPATPGSAMTLADGAITAAKIAADALAAAKLAADACEKIADILLRRTMANVEGSSNGDALSVNSLYGAVQQAQESAISGATQTIKKTDGSTTLGTKTISTSAGADPIRGIS
jgi:hypothetical protein